MVVRAGYLFAISMALGLGAVLSAAPAPATKPRASQTLAISSFGSWKTVRSGAEFRKIILERTEPAQTIELKLFRFDPRLIAARVVYGREQNLRVADVKTIAEKTGAIAAINANYFDPEGRPLAFLKTGAKTVNAKISPSSLYTGVFAIKGNQPMIMHRNEFAPAEVDEAIQSGPLLLLRGALQSYSGVPLRASRRSLIGIDREHRVIVAATDSLLGGLTWPEVQEIFTASQGRIELSELLAMDGGGSAQLYFKSANFEQLVAGASEVPVAIGFFDR